MIRPVLRETHGAEGEGRESRAMALLEERAGGSVRWFDAAADRITEAFRASLISFPIREAGGF